jgi:steroid delta-isomerase-like uncharacterized protein
MPIIRITQTVTLFGLALLAAPLLTGKSRAQDASPTPPDEPEVIAAYTEAIGVHDAGAVVALYTEDAVVVQAVGNGGTFEGPDAIRAWVSDNLAAIPDLTMATEGVIVEGDRIAWQWVYRGSYTGAYPGLPAGQGQPIELRGASFIELEDGRIARETIYFDNASFTTQVAGAATPAP